MSTKSKDKLKNKRVVIIGGSSGIGFAVAAGARQGQLPCSFTADYSLDEVHDSDICHVCAAALDSCAEVIIASSTQPKVDAAVARLDSSNASGRTVDISSEELLTDFFTSVGPFDHLVYTAGDALQLGPFEQVALILCTGQSACLYSLDNHDQLKLFQCCPQTLCWVICSLLC